jgi:DNA-binding Lrp family transcriptional regulator
MLTDDIRLRILRELENDPVLSQRDLAKALSVSLFSVSRNCDMTLNGLLNKTT